jgi:hypothetical protein
VAVAHPEPGVAVLLHVVLRSAEPADEEEGEAIAGAAIHLAALIQRMEPQERGLPLHRIVETLHQLADGLFASDGIERAVHGRFLARAGSVASPLAARGSSCFTLP